MQSNTRMFRCAGVLWAVIVLVSCAGQKQPAQNLIGDIEATVMAAAPEAAKYVPDQLADVQGKLSDLKASFAKQDYAAVLGAAPAALASAQSLATAAAAKKDEVLKAQNDAWTSLADTVPDYVTAIRNRIEFLSQKSNKKQAAGLDLDAARSGVVDAAALWSKAQAAFAAGNLEEAVATASNVKAKVVSLAASLKLQLAKA